MDSAGGEAKEEYSVSRLLAAIIQEFAPEDLIFPIPPASIEFLATRHSACRCGYQVCSSILSRAGYNECLILTPGYKTRQDVKRVTPKDIMQVVWGFQESGGND